MTYNFLVESGVTITNADINFYSNDASLPDQLIETRTVVPLSNTVINEFIEQDVIQVVFEVDPVFLEGQAGVLTTYW